MDSITYYPRISAVTDLAPSSQSVLDFVRNKIRLKPGICVMPTRILSLALDIEQRDEETACEYPSGTLL